jgi:GNAT superfamily N-acetyltransferase
MSLSVPTYRPQRQSDQDFLRHLLTESKGQEFAALGLSPPALVGMVVETQVRAHLAAANPDHRGHIVEYGGQDVGWLVWRPDADVLHLVELRLLSSWCGRGLGTMLLTDLHSQAAGLGLSLLVSPFNPARRLYARLGFVETATDGAMVAMAWRGVS